MRVTHVAIVASAAACLIVTPVLGRSAARKRPQSCREILSRAIAASSVRWPARPNAPFADSIWQVIDSAVPRRLVSSTRVEGMGHASPRAPTFTPWDTLATRLDALILKEPDTVAAREQIARVFADLLSGLREPTQLQVTAVGLVYNRMGLPPGPVEAVARDLRLEVNWRTAALHVLEDAPIDSALVDVMFVNLCQVGMWAGAMPLSDSVVSPMTAAVTGWGETILNNVLLWTVGNEEVIRSLAPCKSLEECFPDSPSLLAWIRRRYREVRY